MYTPAHFEETDRSVLHALIRAHPLGTWVTQADGDLLANHIPFVLDPDHGEHGMLVGHVARANPVWRSFSQELESLVVFQGADAYISPSWYPAKREHGKVVPTWNYAVVHAHGLPRAIEDPAWLRRALTLLTHTHEQGQAQPWQVSDAPPDFTERLMEAIVGIEIPITRLQGKWKISQNRSAPDRQGVVAGLSARDDAGSHAMAALMSPPVGGAGA